jgi:DNA-binding beta-propeller fold protein YncE
MRVPRWSLAVLGAAVLVAAADVGVLVATREGADQAVSVAARAGAGDAVAVIDPASRTVVDRVRVGAMPTAVVAGPGGVWVLNRGDGTLTHIDARTRRVARTVEPDTTANDIALGAGGLWLAGRPRDALSHPLEFAELERLDPGTGDVDRRLATSTGATSLVAAGEALWSSGYLGGHVRGAARSDALTGAMRHVEIGIYGDLITAGSGAVYFVTSSGNRIARVSLGTGRMTAQLPLSTDASLAAGLVPPSPTDVAVGGGSVWVSTSGGTVLRVDPRLTGLQATIPACGSALALSYGEGAVWVACGDDSVVRVDPATDLAGEPIPVGRLPRGIAAGDGAVWVTLN